MESEKKTIICEDCDAENSADSAFCGSCGAKILKEPTETEVEQTEAEQETVQEQEQTPIAEATQEPALEQSLAQEMGAESAEVQVGIENPEQYSDQMLTPEPGKSFFSKYKNVLIIVVASIIAVVGIVFALNEMGKANLQKQLLKDWSRVEDSEGTYYTLELDFSEDEIEYIFDCYFFTEEIATYEYEIVSGNKIKIKNRYDAVHTIEFNDEKTMMTITPALTSVDPYENWFYHSN